MELRLIKNTSFLFLLTAFSCSFITQNKSQSHLLYDKWKGQYDDMEMYLTLKKNKGSITYQPRNSTYNFEFIIKNDSLIQIKGEKNGVYHRFKLLDKNHLRFYQHPSTNNETVDLIDIVEFERL